MTQFLFVLVALFAFFVLMPLFGLLVVKFENYMNGKLLKYEADLLRKRLQEDPKKRTMCGHLHVGTNPFEYNKTSNLENGCAVVTEHGVEFIPLEYKEK